MTLDPQQGIVLSAEESETLSVWTTVTGYLKITFQTCQQWQKSDLIER